ncbi:MAG: SAM-dependent methyltransferase [Rhodocyclaceae bacterium]|nr:SAM-dependent methyltransferase [Rhodocyclaceae bacterium]
MPGYRVRFQSVPVAGGADLEIRSLLDRNQYSDPDGAADAAGISPASWPLFGLVWPSARKLADLMQRLELGSRRILEVGCGLGLASLVLHRRRGDITASDCHPLAGSFLDANLRLNGLGGMRYRDGHWKRRNPDLGEFDLFVGSDLLYERDHPRQLAGFLRRHAAPAAEVMLVDPDRGNRAQFTGHMRGIGFSLEETRLDAPLSNGDPYRGRLLHYRRAPA